ncbi:MAG: NTP transferase domain-containing protein [Actinomycetia bacterium]|nr:NTP transferase domain-containing protein [Actinomycetes bacterium]MCP4224580.1 NTP transferase domain-containing protein [Actinomycetes bacterium]MCP5034009.1 NTP transferase domain-containing protein [Actinomycetes bacterium]
MRRYTDWMGVAALVTAAGSGTRFGGLKQFAELTPSFRLVDAAVVTARSVSAWVGVILPDGYQWDGIAIDGSSKGGASRRESIGAGLALLPSWVDTVLIHSASHPLATSATAKRAIDAVAGGADGAVPWLAAVDVIKELHDDDSLTTVGREGLGSAQSPMAFKRSILDRAFATDGQATEESQLVEAIGGRIVAVAGQLDNVHVVDDNSLALARTIAAGRGVV